MKIALCGSAPSSCQLAPYADQSYQQFAAGKTPAYPPAPHIAESWQIWGCSPGLYGVAPRANRWFEVHRWEPGKEWFSPEYVQYLKQFNGPVYTGGHVEDLAHNQVIYPLAEVEAEFSSFFLNSSLSLMAAIAILDIEQVRRARRAADPAMLPMGASRDELAKDDSDDVIGFWGVDMSANEEYSRQKPGCWFFMLEALRRGIGVYYPPESDLGCPEPVYGIAEWDHAYIKATTKMREINQRSANTQQQLSTLTAQMAADAGVRDCLNYQIKNWMAARYALPAGIVLRHDAGTGLGVTITSMDGKPTTP